MIKALRFTVLLALAALLAAPLFATTYIVPSDAEMIQKADDIAIVTGVSSIVERDARGGIVTRYTLRVVETLKGDREPGSHLVVTEIGGEINGAFSFVEGTPEYQPGERYLVFTTADRDFEPTTFGKALGQFRFVDQNASRLAVRQSISGFDQNFEPYQERARDAQRFAGYIRDTIAQRGTAADYFVPNARQQQIQSEAIAATAAYNRTSYLMSSGGKGFRWSNPSVNWVRSGTQTGADTAVNVAFSQWNGTATNINYVNSGVDNSALGGNGSSDGKNAILYNDPTNEIPDGSGIAGQGGVKGTSQYTFGGETFWNVGEADVVIANMSFSQSCLNGVMTHEVGHTLGFRHANQVPSGFTCGSTAECTSSAIMNSSVNCSFNGVLQGYDDNAAETVYGDGSTAPPACNPPTVTTQPQNKTVNVGVQTTLSVVVGGTGPFTYQWFNGDSGNTSSPVNGANGASLTITMNAAGSAKFWVRIGHSCDNATVNSATATITAATSACNPPTINSQPQNKNVNVGVQTTLSVVAGGTGPFTYQWFSGDSGNTSSPVNGGTSSSLTLVMNAAGSAKFWVRVRHACDGATANSATATITATASCTLPTISAQPQDQTINPGQSATLTIAFSMNASVKWYRGTLGDRSAQVGTAASVNVGPLSATTKYWAEVTNLCGPVASRQVTVTVRGLTELVSMLNNRFVVQVRYKNQFDGNKTGKLVGRSLFSSSTSDTAVFTFGDANVVELMVRLSDARPFDDNVHVFLGGLSDVEFAVVVTDSGTGIVHEYKKPANQLVGVIDRTTFPAATSFGTNFDSALFTPPIVADAETSTIKLLNGRFQVRMRYRNQFTSPAGTGYLNARSIASTSTTETAVFYFGENAGSAEWMVRFSDARPFANRIDMFHGGLSDVEFTIEVLDTKTGVRKEYAKAPFSLMGKVDRTSFKP